MKLAPRSRRLVVWLGIVSVLYVSWCGLLYFQQDGMVYPIPQHGRTAEHIPERAEALWFTGAGGVRVEGWLMLPVATPAPLVVFAHGNGELIDDCVGVADEYRRRGYAVLLPEYRGYGRSGGRPRQAEISADLVGLYDMAIALPEIDRTRVVFHGRSLGGGVAAQLAAVRKPSVLIMQSSFTSIASFADGMLVPRFVVTNPFHTDDVLPTLGVPVLIMHGVDDDIIPVTHGRRLHEITPGSVYVEMPGHHNDFPVDATAYWKAIDGFLSDKLPRTK